MTKFKKTKLITIIAALVLLCIVILQNTDEVTTTILFAKVTMPHAFSLFLTFIFGALFGISFVYIKSNPRIAKDIKQINHQDHP